MKKSTNTITITKDSTPLEVAECQQFSKIPEFTNIIQFHVDSYQHSALAVVKNGVFLVHLYPTMKIVQFHLIESEEESLFDSFWMINKDDIIAQYARRPNKDTTLIHFISITREGNRITELKDMRIECIPKEDAMSSQTQPLLPAKKYLKYYFPRNSNGVKEMTFSRSLNKFSIKPLFNHQFGKRFAYSNERACWNKKRKLISLITVDEESRPVVQISNLRNRKVIKQRKLKVINQRACLNFSSYQGEETEGFEAQNYLYTYDGSFIYAQDLKTEKRYQLILKNKSRGGGNYYDVICSVVQAYKNKVVIYDPIPQKLLLFIFEKDCSSYEFVKEYDLGDLKGLYHAVALPEHQSLTFLDLKKRRIIKLKTTFNSDEKDQNVTFEKEGLSFFQWYFSKRVVETPYGYVASYIPKHELRHSSVTHLSLRNPCVIFFNKEFEKLGLFYPQAECEPGNSRFKSNMGIKVQKMRFDAGLRLHCSYPRISTMRIYKFDESSLALKEKWDLDLGEQNHVQNFCEVQGSETIFVFCQNQTTKEKNLWAIPTKNVDQKIQIPLIQVKDYKEQKFPIFEYNEKTGDLFVIRTWRIQSKILKEGKRKIKDISKLTIEKISVDGILPEKESSKKLISNHLEIGLKNRILTDSFFMNSHIALMFYRSKSIVLYSKVKLKRLREFKIDLTSIMSQHPENTHKPNFQMIKGMLIIRLVEHTFVFSISGCRQLAHLSNKLNLVTLSKPDKETLVLILMSSQGYLYRKIISLSSE